MRPKAVLTILGLAAATASAQTPPMTPEIPVNTYTTNSQDVRAGAASIDRFGNVVLVWDSFGEDGDGYGSYGRRFDASGTPLGTAFPINESTTGSQSSPAVGSDRNGNFVVAWQSAEGQDGDLYGVFARRFNASGNPISGDFQVNTYTTGSQRLPAIAVNSAGRFVIVWWDSDGHDGDSGGIFGQLYDDNGAAVGAEFPVNTYTTGAQQYPSVAMNASGEFVIAWESAGSDGDGYGIMARLFAASGTPASGEIAVNTYTTGDQRHASVGMDRDGNFVVVWDSHGSDGSATGVAGRRFDASGNPLTAEFQVNTYTTSYQGTAELSMDRDGNFVVAWESYRQDGDLTGIVARAFDSSAAPTSPEFPVNVTTTANQEYAAVAVGNGGNFVVGWESTYPDSSGDVVARVGAPQAGAARADVHPAGSGTSDLNGVFESGETVIIEPKYTNALGSPLNIIGLAANFYGPPGPTYVLQDGTADYGSIAAGATNECFDATGDCFVATVTGTRPTAHWDARLDEVLSTGIVKSWTVHIGESFPDVPRSQPFYAFIENLFHNAITGGCGAGNYCPDASVTRAQMAVFLLKSEHDAQYTPPACAGVFGDVPCPSQFADWIEQLSAEGITGGCGGGDFCPGNPVTRAQMAVFLLKAQHGSTYLPPVCTGLFHDVPCPSQFANWIEQLFRRRHHRRLRRRRLLPRQPQHARPDGRLPRQDLRPRAVRTLTESKPL